MPQEPSSPNHLQARAQRSATRSMSLAFAAGLLVAVVVSAGVVCERVLAGNVRAALFVDALVLLIAVPVASLTSRPLNVLLADTVQTGDAMRIRASAILVPQVLGLASGIGLVHLLLKYSGIKALCWMSECPAQLVNDGVAAVGTLLAIWVGASRALRLDLLVPMLGMLLCYGMTRQLWHVDHAPFVFQASIQELVVGQVIAASSGLLAFRRFSFG